MRLIIVTTVAALTLALSFIQQSFTPRPTTFREAVVGALDSRDIAYQEVTVSQACVPDASTCYVHIAQVLVLSDRPINGLVECRHYGRDCHLLLADLGILHAPLPDLVYARTPAWQFAQLAAQARSWLRSWGHQLVAFSTARPTAP